MSFECLVKDELGEEACCLIKHAENVKLKRSSIPTETVVTLTNGEEPKTVTTLRDCGEPQNFAKVWVTHHLPSEEFFLLHDVLIAADYQTLLSTQTSTITPMIPNCPFRKD